KTILQVQLENPEMSDSLKSETGMVLAEINRLGSKLNQLLQFSRPAVLGQAPDAVCDAADLVREAVAVVRPEAERRGISLSTSQPASLPVALGHDALNDILSNLLVNSLEAVLSTGRIQIQASQSDGVCTITVEDDGPGIPASAREKLLEPFFTTKSQG